MKRKLELFMAVLLIAAAAVIAPGSARYVMNMKARVDQVCVCVDSGHGGNDPGKVGAGGTLEKEINLAIALKLKACLQDEGIEVVMTRETDTNLADAGASNQKLSDMKNRVKRIADSGADLTVSIHQNSYTDSSARGAQVFYYGESKEGKALAQVMQQSLIENLDPENHREAKANESYYLLKKTPTPTVIVECGFLSNPEEESRLKDEAYQEQVAQAICKGVTACLRQDQKTHE